MLQFVKKGTTTLCSIKYITNCKANKTSTNSLLGSADYIQFCMMSTEKKSKDVSLPSCLRMVNEN